MLSALRVKIGSFGTRWSLHQPNSQRIMCEEFIVEVVEDFPTTIIYKDDILIHIIHKALVSSARRLPCVAQAVGTSAVLFGREVSPF